MKTMFVVVTGVSTGSRKPDVHRQPYGVSPVSMVWVDPDEPGADGHDEDRAAGPGRAGPRVYGPFETYEEGQVAAMMLAPDTEYWVIPVDPVSPLE